MRDIKFRGFTINEEKYGNGKDGWIYGNLLLLDNKKAQIQDINDDNFFKFIDIKSLGQYTGLHDKNGNEIYEGDIVNIKYKFDNTEYICEIIYIDGAFRTKKFIFGSYYDCLYYWYANDCEIEVIGNIYDNPELLEEGE